MQISSFASFFEHLESGVMLVDNTGTILYANSSLEQLLQFDAGDLVNQRIFSINAEMSLLKLNGYFNKNESKNGEKLLNSNNKVEYLTAKGKPIPVVEHVSAPYTLDGTRLVIIHIESLLKTNRYKDMLELTTTVGQFGGWEWDITSNEVLMTGICLDLLDYKSNDIKVFKTIDLFEKTQGCINNEQLNALILSMRELRAVGQSFSKDVLFKSKKTNKYVKLRISAQASMLSMGVSKVYGTVQIIEGSEFAKNRAALLDFALDHAREMICWIHEDGSFEYVNLAFANKLGYSTDSVIGRNIIDFVKNLDQKKLSEYWKNLKRDEHIEDDIYFINSKGIEIQTFASHGYVRFGEKELSCIYAQDMTSKIRKNWQLNMAYSSMRSASELILWFDDQLIIRYLNPAAVKELTYEKTELKGQHLSRICECDQLKNTLSTGKKKFTLRLLFKDSKGVEFPVEAGVTRVETSFDNKHYSLIGRNIQKLVEKEAAAQKVVKLSNRLKDENIILRREKNEEYNHNQIISVSPKYKQVMSQVARVAATDSSALILGETGTGKELIARAIYSLSERAELPFIKVNCSALPRELIESELFGHEKGAFTGAHAQRKGRFELANKGTIFLDEIGEIPIDLQSKLLRVLQEGEIQRLGSSDTLNVDVRIIAATNRNLESMVQEGTFREDLFYRLNVFPIYNLALRERREDIPALIQHFVSKNAKRLGKKITKVSKADLKMLRSYDFPGNIRELENLVERALILSDSDTLQISAAFSGRTEKQQNAKTKFLTFDEMQREHILSALKKTGWRVSGKHGAGRLLGLNDRTLMSKMRKLDIRREDYL